MQTIDHRMLGISLVKRLEEQQRVPLGCRLMFIWGSIEPDLNYLTFLKGFLRCSSLKGHSFVNSSRRIKVPAGKDRRQISESAEILPCRQGDPLSGRRFHIPA